MSGYLTLMTTVTTMRLVKEKRSLRKKEQALRRLHTAIDCYEKQHRAGRYLLHEHLDGASSWDDARMEALQKLDGVFTVSGPTCR